MSNCSFKSSSLDKSKEIKAMWVDFYWTPQYDWIALTLPNHCPQLQKPTNTRAISTAHFETIGNKASHANQYHVQNNVELIFCCFYFLIISFSSGLFVLNHVKTSKMTQIFRPYKIFVFHDSHIITGYLELITRLTAIRPWNHYLHCGIHDIYITDLQAVRNRATIYLRA